jgi:hypothetical protein
MAVFYLCHVLSRIVRYLQDVFDVPLIIQMTDDEKFLFKPKLTLDHDPVTGVLACVHACKREETVVNSCC